MIAGAVSVGYQLQIEADFITQDDRSGSTAAVGALPVIGLLAGAERTNSVGMRTLGLGRSAARIARARQQVDAKTGHVAQPGR